MRRLEMAVRVVDVMADSVEQNTDVDLDQLHHEARGNEPASPAAQIRKALRGKHVCPFCGTTRETDLGPCQQCSLEDTPSTRNATRTKLGPWYVLQSRNPSAPGMNFATLLTLVQKSRVTARSVIRGPTTGQFWKHAAKVKGISREFGLCWNCGGDVAKTARACPSCKRLQEPPLNPDVLLELGESATDDLAEQMWAEEAPERITPSNGNGGNNGYRPGSPAAPSAGTPGPLDTHDSPVDDLIGRGGVRREVPPPIEGPDGNGGGPGRNGQRRLRPNGARNGQSGNRAPGLIADGDAELSVHSSHGNAGLEMAVFQGPYREDRTIGTPSDPGGRGSGFFRKLFKSLFVAVLLAGVGVGAMCWLDPVIGQRVMDYGKKLLRDVGVKIDGAAGANLGTPSAPQRATAVSTAALEQARVRMWDLWKAGREAESHNDYALAVQKLEEIKKLPVDESDWPLGLESRISILKKGLKP